MSLESSFESNIKTFLSSKVINPLAKIAVDNRDLNVDDLVQKFKDHLKLPSPTLSIVKTQKKRTPKNSPKNEQQWISHEEYNEQSSKDKYLCGYVQTRGVNKDKYCGIILNDTNVVSWEGTSFLSSSIKKELEECNNRVPDMRCKHCWSRDAKTGQQKRKKGRADKLVSQQNGDVLAPTIIPGVSVPDNVGLMGFLSGNTNRFQSPSRAMDKPAKKVVRAKRLPGLIRTEDYSHVVLNPEHHKESWLIRADSDGQTVVGKFEKQPTLDTHFEEGYEDDIISLTEEEQTLCHEYGMKYKFNKHEDNEDNEESLPIIEDDDDGLPIVTERENDTSTIQDELDIPTLDS